MPVPAWMEWTERLPCARAEATIVVSARRGERLAWDDPLRAGACGRDEPAACSPALRARLDADGFLTCDAETCAWEIPGADFDAARVWADGRGPIGELRCSADPATGARLSLGDGPRVIGTMWHGEPPVVAPGEHVFRLSSDLVTVTLLDTLPPPLLDPASLEVVGPKVAWTRWRGVVPAEARESGYFDGGVPTCKAEAWRSPAPDLDGDGVDDALVRLRTTFGEDCAAPDWTLARTFVLRPDGTLGARIDGSGGPEETTIREVEAFVALPEGRVGVRGAITHLACCDQWCTLTGAWVGLVEAGTVSVLGDTSGACPERRRAP